MVDNRFLRSIRKYIVVIYSSSDIQYDVALSQSNAMIIKPKLNDIDVFDWPTFYTLLSYCWAVKNVDWSIYVFFIPIKLAVSIRH